VYVYTTDWTFVTKWPFPTGSNSHEDDMKRTKRWGLSTAPRICFIFARQDGDENQPWWGDIICPRRRVAYAAGRGSDRYINGSREIFPSIVELVLAVEDMRAEMFQRATLDPGN